MYVNDRELSHLNGSKAAEKQRQSLVCGVFSVRVSLFEHFIIISII